MDIRILQEEDVTVVELNGRLDELSAPELEGNALAAAGRPGVRLLIDFANVEYVSSAGLRVMLQLTKTARKHSGEVKFCGLNPFVREVVAISHLGELFDIHPEREDALRTF